MAARRNPSSNVSWSKTHRANGRAPGRAGPFCPGRRDMGSHDRGVEHLNQVRGLTHDSERFEKRLEDAGLAQPPKPYPNAVLLAELGGKRSPSDVMDRKVEPQLLTRRASSTIIPFGPEDIASMSAAFEAALGQLGLQRFNNYGDRQGDYWTGQRGRTREGSSPSSRGGCKLGLEITTKMASP